MDAIERALEILGLGPDATPEAIKQAYRDLTKVWHPDRFQNDLRVRLKAFMIYRSWDHERFRPRWERIGMLVR